MNEQSSPLFALVSGWSWHLKVHYPTCISANKRGRSTNEVFALASTERLLSIKPRATRKSFPFSSKNETWRAGSKGFCALCSTPDEWLKRSHLTWLWHKVLFCFFGYSASSSKNSIASHKARLILNSFFLCLSFGSRSTKRSFFFTRKALVSEKDESMNWNLWIKGPTHALNRRIASCSFISLHSPSSVRLFTRSTHRTFDRKASSENRSARREELKKEKKSFIFPWQRWKISSRHHRERKTSTWKFREIKVKTSQPSEIKWKKSCDIISSPLTQFMSEKEKLFV